jgi:hypothetical protein
VMLHDKNTIELRILQDMPSKEWSDLWVNNILDTSKLTLYACCTSCNRICPAATIGETMRLLQREIKNC